MQILLLHGPNLNLLGTREPEKYGHATAESILSNLQKEFPTITFNYFQSNHEGELIDAVQKAKNQYDGILINAGGFSHTSIGLADAIRSIQIPTISIHITNIYNREDYRQIDIVGQACLGAIVGLGTNGYQLATECLIDEINK